MFQMRKERLKVTNTKDIMTQFTLSITRHIDIAVKQESYFWISDRFRENEGHLPEEVGKPMKTL